MSITVKDPGRKNLMKIGVWTVAGPVAGPVVSKRGFGVIIVFN